MGQGLTIHFVDHDVHGRADAARQIIALGHHAEVYSELEELGGSLPQHGIVVVHITQARDEVSNTLAGLSAMGVALPLVVASEATSVDRIVEAVRSGALDYLPLPLEPGHLQAMIERVSRELAAEAEARLRMIDARNRLGRLSEREHQVLERLMDGGSNKEIARDLEISPRTVEIHRANMMQKLSAKHIAEAVRFYFEAQPPLLA